MEKVVVTEMNDIENTRENVIERKTATQWGMRKGMDLNNT